MPVRAVIARMKGRVMVEIHRMYGPICFARMFETAIVDHMQ